MATRIMRLKTWRIHLTGVDVIQWVLYDMCIFCMIYMYIVAGRTNRDDLAWDVIFAFTLYSFQDIKKP